MPPKRKTQASSASKETYVYLLTMEQWNHAGEGTMTSVAGVYESKEAAVASAGSINTDYGTFDEAIEGDFSEEGEHEDNRSDPPDDGILLQIGGDDVGEGDYCRVLIQKCPILGMPASSGAEKKRKK